MINGKIYFIVGGISLVTGLLAGTYFGYAVLCPSTSDAIVKQLDKDVKKVKAIREKEKVRDAKTEKDVVYIERVVAGECFDKPIPDNVADRLLNTLSN